MNDLLVKFVIINIIFLGGCIYATHLYQNYKLSSKNKKTRNFIEFINNGRLPKLNKIFIGLVFGIVFGFIDNIVLWIGEDVLMDYLPGGILTKSAIGNTYSNVFGAVMGTCMTIIVRESIDHDGEDISFHSQPIWINTIGIFVGCSAGLILGRLVTNES